MKFVLVKHVLVSAALLALVVTPASALVPSRAWIEQSVGQEVFSLKNTPVGRLERYIDVRGTPGVLIKGGDAFGGRTIIVPAQDLSPRTAGGLLLMLTDRGIAGLQPYQPGRLPMW
jgi:hypothetical protein